MNIVVIGSCTDSSILAKELNQRLTNSLVVRIDMLKTIKQLILEDAKLGKTDALGTYIGDVETHNYANLSQETKEKIVKAFNSVEKGIKDIGSKRSYPFIASTFDALTNGLPTNTYSFIKVYSGAITDERLNNMLSDDSFINNTIVVKIETPKDQVLPISISKNILESAEKKAFTYIKCNRVEEVFTSDVFKLLFELNSDKKEKAAPKPEAANEATVIRMHLDPVPAGELLAEAA